MSRFACLALFACLMIVGCNPTPAPVPPPMPPSPDVPEVVTPVLPDDHTLPSEAPDLSKLEVITPDQIPEAETPPPGVVGVVNGVTVPNNQFVNVAWSGGCTGTLINPKWVITAAHCNPGKGTKWTFTLPNGTKKTYTTESAIRPSAYNPAAFSLGNDVALCKLTEAVTDITPAELDFSAYKATAKVILIGYGLTGTPTAGETGGAGVKRRADQIVDFVLAPHYLWMFNAPETATVGRGDSGGPLFAKDSAGRDTNKIIAVVSGCSVGAGGKVGIYGTYAFMTRLDVHKQWILDNVK